MEYEKYPTINDAKRRLPYTILIFDELLDLPRRSYIRWLDPSTDMFIQMFDGHDSLSPRLFFLQGKGPRCTTDVSRVPTKQHAELTLPDGRKAVSGLGVEDNGWDKSGPPWVVWPTHEGLFRRVEGSLLSRATLENLARQISLQES